MDGLKGEGCGANRLLGKVLVAFIEDLALARLLALPIPHGLIGFAGCIPTGISCDLHFRVSSGRGCVPLIPSLSMMLLYTLSSRMSSPYSVNLPYQGNY